MPRGFSMNRAVAVALILMAYCCGCDTGDFSTETTGSRVNTPSTAIPAGDRSGKEGDAVCEVTLGDKQTFEELLKKHRGKVVLVDFWATWCPPCVLQFSHTVELSNQHRDAGLAVISVSMNEPTDRESVQAFLAKRQANFDHLLTHYGAGSAFVDAFELRGDIPFYRLYDRSGRLRYSFSNDPSGIEDGEPIEQIDQRVEQLLSESQSSSGN